MSKVKIAGQLTPEEALAVLFNASGPQGIGELQFMPCHTMTPEEAAKVNGYGISWEYISNKMKYWERWSWRWEALAEKFKEE